MKIKILIADDNKRVRDGLKMLINHLINMEVVGEAENGQETIELTRELHPDVVLMDCQYACHGRNRSDSPYLLWEAQYKGHRSFHVFRCSLRLEHEKCRCRGLCPERRFLRGHLRSHPKGYGIEKLLIPWKCPAALSR